MQAEKQREGRDWRPRCHADNSSYDEAGGSGGAALHLIIGAVRILWHTCQVKVSDKYLQPVSHNTEADRPTKCQLTHIYVNKLRGDYNIPLCINQPQPKAI